MSQEISNWLAAGYGWVIATFAIVLSTLLIHFLEVRLYRRIHPKLARTQSVWDDTLIYAIHKPLGFLIWIIGLALAATYVGMHFGDGLLLEIVPTIRKVGVTGLSIWALVRFVSGVENRILSGSGKPKEVDPTTVQALSQLFRASVIITGGLILLQTLGIGISGLLAFGGMGGLIAGLAAKDLLANFFGGFMIFLDRPFKVGDWISSPDKEIEGTVEHIGWRLTRIRKFDKRPLYVPNGLFSTISVENPSRMTNRRIYTTIGLRYEDASRMATVLEDIEEMLRNHPEIDVRQTLMVNLIEFGPSSLDFMIYTFTKTTDWVKFQAIQQDVFLKIIEIIEAHGAEVAFPTTTMHVPDGIKMKEGGAKLPPTMRYSTEVMK